MSLERYLLLLSFPFFMAIGQILLKATAGRHQETNKAEALLSLLTDPVFYSALAVYGLATLLWIYILRIVPLNLAYPWAALSFLLVPIASYFFFCEPLTPRYLFGVSLIVVGIVIAVSGR